MIKTMIKTSLTSMKIQKTDRTENIANISANNIFNTMSFKVMKGQFLVGIEHLIADVAEVEGGGNGRVAGFYLYI